MFDPVDDKLVLTKDVFDQIDDQSKNRSVMMFPSTAPPYEMSAETVTYGINVVKNAASYTADKVYSYEWRDNISKLTKDISENVFPVPKDPRLDFIKTHPNFEDRLKLSSSLKKQYPTHVPLILERDRMSRLMPLKKKKLIVPGSLNSGELNYSVRSIIPGLNSYEGLIIMLTKYDRDGIVQSTNMLVPNLYTISDLYEQNKSEDNFLYINIKEENVFG